MSEGASAESEYSLQPELLRALRQAIERDGELVLEVTSGHFLYASVPSKSIEPSAPSSPTTSARTTHASR